MYCLLCISCVSAYMANKRAHYARSDLTCCSSWCEDFKSFYGELQSRLWRTYFVFKQMLSSCRAPKWHRHGYKCPVTTWDFIIIFQLWHFWHGKRKVAYLETVSGGGSVGVCGRVTLSSKVLSNAYTLKCSGPYMCNPPFLISDIRALWRSGLSARVPECQKLNI